MHRRVNSNIIDQNAKPINFHRRTLSNSDLQLSPGAFNPHSIDFLKQKPQLVLPDSLNSSAIQPHLQNEENNFIEILDSSIKHFTSITPASNPLKQIADLKHQIAYMVKNLEAMKENKNELSLKYTSLLSKSDDLESENEKLQECVQDLKEHTEKLKNSLQKSENDLKILKKKNEQIGKSVIPVKKDQKVLSNLKNEVYTNSSNDEIDVFNAEENTCMQFSDPFQFANPSPKVQGKSLYQRLPIKK